MAKDMKTGGDAMTPSTDEVAAGDIRRVVDARGG
jgi:hypothetical protein